MIEEADGIVFGSIIAFWQFRIKTCYNTIYIIPMNIMIGNNETIDLINKILFKTSTLY